jgi:hypothetical protein
LRQPLFKIHDDWDDCEIPLGEIPAKENYALLRSASMGFLFRAAFQTKFEAALNKNPPPMKSVRA